MRLILILDFILVCWVFLIDWLDLEEIRCWELCVGDVIFVFVVGIVVEICWLYYVVVVVVVFRLV